MVMQHRRHDRRDPDLRRADWSRDPRRAAPTKGRLLLATPPLEDPNFDRTVVYMLEHHDDGAVGVVLNRPTDEELGEPLDRVGRPAGDARLGVPRAARSSPTR